MSTELFPERSKVEGAIKAYEYSSECPPYHYLETLRDGARAYLLMLPVNEANKASIERLEKQVEELKGKLNV